MAQKGKRSAYSRRESTKAQGAKQIEGKPPSGLERERREEVIQDIVRDLDDYMKESPQLRQRVIAAVAKEPAFRAQLSAKIVGEFTS